MLWFHPVLQLFATTLGIYAGYLGMERFMSMHLGKRTQFLWKRHVSVGQTAMFIWMAGLAGGLIMARLKWNVNLVTGDHYKVAFSMIPLLFFGAASGLILDRKRKKRTLLPIMHGLCNLALLSLATYQIFTGWQVIKDFIL